MKTLKKIGIFILLVFCAAMCARMCQLTTDSGVEREPLYEIDNWR